MKVCVLASSSAANCIYVASADTAVLIDAGLSLAETERRMERAGIDPATVRALCVSHEHSDHTRGIGAVHRRFGMALYANAGTVEGLRLPPQDRSLPWKIFATGVPFEVGDLVIEPFSVPHDAYDPVGFVVSHGGWRVGIATDLGMATALIRERLRTCQVLVLEANHDEHLLLNSARPWRLKQRIRGRQGHLSNAHAADLLAELAGPHLRQVFLAHLSRECNEQDLALREVRQRLAEDGHGHVAVCPTYRHQSSEWCDCAAFAP